MAPGSAGAGATGAGGKCAAMVGTLVWVDVWGVPGWAIVEPPWEDEICANAAGAVAPAPTRL